LDFDKENSCGDGGGGPVHLQAKVMNIVRSKSRETE